ncbi:uncharacterized protein [Littorina saxatilis]|uniref:TIR domain-containing protein n=1 Tax=Littorina saxatilis TaxID=31220 RepID=A0AAN9ALK2_9CAEN
MGGAASASSNRTVVTETKAEVTPEVSPHLSDNNTATRKDDVSDIPQKDDTSGEKDNKDIDPPGKSPNTPPVEQTGEETRKHEKENAGEGEEEKTEGGGEEVKASETEAPAEEEEEDDDEDDEDDEDDDDEEDEEQAAERYITKHTELFQQTRLLWDERMTSLTDHVEEVCDAHSDYWRFTREIQNTFWDKAGNRLIDSGSFAIVCDIATECLRLLNVVESATADKMQPSKRRELLVQALSALWNYTDCCERVAAEICKHQQLLQQLLIYLKVALTRNGNRPLQRDKVSMSAIAIFHNIARREQNVKHLREIEDFIVVIQSYLSSSDIKLKLITIMLLALVVTEVEANLLSTSPDTIKTLLVALFAALEDDIDHRSGEGYAAVELLQAVKHLSKNAENTDLLIKGDVLKLLRQGLLSDDNEERLGSIESLWWLTFKKEVREIMIKDTAIIDLVVKSYQDKNDICNEAADGMLFELRDLLKIHERPDLKALGGTFLTKDKDEDTSGSSGHVMLSYSKHNRDLVNQVRLFLQENGIKVWMDVLFMANAEDSTSQAMAEAVEDSAVFLLCFSDDYIESQPCKQEAEYALKQKKFIIPLRLQRGYDPTGWLGFIIGNRYFVDVSKEEVRQDKLVELLGKVKKRMNTSFDEIDSSKAVLLKTVSSGGPTPVKQWTQQDVDQWLSNNNLQGKKLRSLTGKQIAFLVTLKKLAPDRFFQLLSSELGVKTLADMTDFLHALDSV